MEVDRDNFDQVLAGMKPRLAYRVAKNRGLDVDKPRNLAKSVTVE